MENLELTTEIHHRIALDIVAGKNIAYLCDAYMKPRNEMIKLRYSSEVENLVDLYSRDNISASKFFILSHLDTAIRELVAFLGLPDISAREELTAINMILHYCFDGDVSKAAHAIAGSASDIKGGKRETIEAVKKKLLRLHGG
jgi:hypothetical protein